ncbi:PREDICTED: uncharacterized protein LOC106740540 isoform X7 [Dinoponera quadriceps]|nr:PREDICTED: uncharacterized protein LOC106740540 isoform X7 [Dinoponera quadriceps]
MDATWVKTNPTGETIEGCESVKQGAEMQQNVDEKADLFDVTSVKINPTGETIEEPAEQGAGKLQNAGKKTVAATPWQVATFICAVVCVAAFILVNAAWLYSTYFPPRCITAPTSISSSGSSGTSEYEDRL